MYHDDDQDEQADGGAGSGLRSKLRHLFSGLRRGDEFEDEDDYEAPAPTIGMSRGAASRPVAPPTYSTAPRRESTIAVLSAATFVDAQRSADRIKQGEPQIINFEKTPPEMATRLVDFLSGVTYALNGSVDPVSAHVYLFTPASITVHSEDTAPAPTNPKSFFGQL